MENLGVVLERLTKGITDERILAGIQEARRPTMTVERMRLAPPLTKIQKDCDAAQTRLDGLRIALTMASEYDALSLRPRIRQQEVIVSKLNDLLVAARARSDLAKQRAKDWGCKPWCLGTGWQRVSTIVPLEEGKFTVSGTSEYCVCPEAIEAKEEHDQERADRQRIERDRRIARLLGNANIVDPEYLECTLENHPNRALARACQRWLDDKAGGAEHPWLYVYGGFGCLAGDSMISINRGGKGFSIRIEDLVDRFNGDKYPPGPRWDLSIPTMVQRAMEDGTVRLARLVRAWRSGVKTTYVVTTESGRSIRATDEHPFLTERGWLRLDQVQIGDMVYVRGDQASGRGTQRARGERKKYRLRRVSSNHPYSKSWGKVTYVPEHRIVAEARLNGLSLDTFLERVAENDLGGLMFLDPESEYVHHRDDNGLNNDPSNLEIMTPIDHATHHGHEFAKNVLFKVGTESVAAIEPYGEEETFDLEVADDPHNFIADGFVVHNSGKTAALYSIVRWWIENRGQAVFRTVPELLDEIRDTYGVDRVDPDKREGRMTAKQLLDAYIEAPLLALDDLGAENLTDRNADWVEEQLFKLLNSRHNGRMPTILSANVGLSSLSERTGDRIYNRVLRMADTVYSGEINLREALRDGSNGRAS